MLTEKEISEITQLERGFEILENPSDPKTDPALALIAERMVQFANSKHINPNRVVIADFDIATISTDDPQNLTDSPQYEFIVRHKKTRKTDRMGILSRKGWMVPFMIVRNFSDLAE